jgi:hypothetical protein
LFEEEPVESYPHTHVLTNYYYAYVEEEREVSKEEAVTDPVSGLPRNYKNAGISGETFVRYSPYQP